MGLSPKEVKAAVQQVEREEGYKFPVRPKVTYGPKQDPQDFAHWDYYEDPKTGKPKKFVVNIAPDEAKPVQEAFLIHELREAARQFKGESATRAHAYAMRKEKEHLAKKFKEDPKTYGDSRGTPYKKTLWLREKFRKDKKKSPSKGKAKGARHDGVFAKLKRSMRWF